MNETLVKFAEADALGALRETYGWFEATAWVQGTWGEYDPEKAKLLMCSAGGLRNARGGDPAETPYDDDGEWIDVGYLVAVYSLTHVILETEWSSICYPHFDRSHLGTSEEFCVGVIVDWNDDDGRERYEVLAAFREAEQHVPKYARDVLDYRDERNNEPDDDE